MTILVQSSKKGTSCAPVLPPAPSFLPVTPQGAAPSSERHGPGRQGWGRAVRPLPSQLWQKPLAGRRVFNPGLDRVKRAQPLRAFGSTRVESPKGQMAVKVTPPLPPPLA